VLASGDIHGHNDFEHPLAVVPVDADIKAQGKSFTYTFAPASVTKLTLALA